SLARSAMLDDADMRAPQAGRRAGGFALEDADLVGIGTAQGRRRVQRYVGVAAGAVNPVAVGLVSQRDRAGEHRDAAQYRTRIVAEPAGGAQLHIRPAAWIGAHPGRENLVELTPDRARVDAGMPVVGRVPGAQILTGLQRMR